MVARFVRRHRLDIRSNSAKKRFELAAALESGVTAGARRATTLLKALPR